MDWKIVKILRCVFHWYTEKLFVAFVCIHKHKIMLLMCGQNWIIGRFQTWYDLNNWILFSTPHHSLLLFVLTHFSILNVVIIISPPPSYHTRCRDGRYIEIVKYDYLVHHKREHPLLYSTFSLLKKSPCNKRITVVSPTSLM